MTTVNLTKENMELLTKSVFTMPAIYSATESLDTPIEVNLTPTTARVPNGFGDWAACLLRTIISTQNAVKVYMAYRDKPYVVVNINNTDSTSPIFDVFKRLGIYSANLAYTYVPQSNTLILGHKLYKTISPLKEITLTGIAIMLKSIAIFLQAAGTGELTVSDKTKEEMCLKKNPRLELNYDSTWFIKVCSEMDLSEGKTMYVDMTVPDPFDSVSSANLYKCIVGEPNWYKPEACKANWWTLLANVNDVQSVIVGYGDTDTAISINGICIIQNTDTLVTRSMTIYDIMTPSFLNDLFNILGFDERYTTIRFVKSKDMKIVLNNAPEDAESVEDSDSTVSAINAYLRIALKDVTVGNLENVTNLKKVFDVTVPRAKSAVVIESMLESYKDDEYAQQLYRQIKPYYKDFDLGESDINLTGFMNGSIYSMMFVGESGTGKSTAARVIPARSGIPYVSINFSVNLEESDIVGCMMPNDKKASADDPEFVWKDGILTKAVRNGYCIILEELNFARPGVLGKLNSLLDENRQLDLPTGEIIVAHKNFRIIATCNIAYEGTNRFNKALINRFDDVVEFCMPEREKLVQIITSRTGYSNMEKINPVLNAYESVVKFGKEHKLELVCSVRQLLNLFSKGKYYKNVGIAFKRILLNGAFIEEGDYKELYENEVLKAFKLDYKL